MRISVLIITMCIFGLNILFAQDRRGKFSGYGIKDGLSQSTVIQIFQDKLGYIWMGTTDGLNRFDGEKFTVFKNKYYSANSLSDNWIASILLEDSENNLWILTSDRVINKFNIRTNSCVRYIPDDKDSSAIYPFGERISVLEDTTGYIWFSTNTGIYRLSAKGKKVQNYTRKIRNFSGRINNAPFRLFKDNTGNIWLFSKAGLLRYVEKEDKFLEYSSGQGLPALGAFRLFEDNKKQLWALTSQGLSLYNRFSDSFSSFLYTIDSTTGGGKMDIFSVKVDKNGNFWIGTYNGLLRFNSISNAYTLFVHKENDIVSISDNRITTINESSDGSIWIGTFNGINKMNPHEAVFERYLQKSGSLADNAITWFFELNNGEKWVLGRMAHSPGSYLSKIDENTKCLQYFENNPCDKTSIPCSFVFNPFVDRTGNLWFGSFGDGAVKYTPRLGNFYHYGKVSGSSSVYSSVWGFCEDARGNIWYATYDQGFSKFDTLSKKITSYKPEIIIDKIPVKYPVMGLQADKKGKIWLATLGAGLLCFDPETNEIRNYVANPKKTNSISSNFVRYITLNRNGELLLGHEEKGVDIFNPATGEVTSLRHDPDNKNSLPANSVWYIFQNKQLNYWISTDGYISYYNVLHKKFTHYAADRNGKTGLLGNKALSIYEGSTGDMWFGTGSSGLSKFNPTTHNFSHYTEEDGLINNVVYGILEAPNGHLWLSTNKGLVEFNPTSMVFKNFGEDAGLQSNEFNQGAFFKSKTNTMYFGGINGFNVFDPLLIVNDSLTPATVLTGLQINNKTIPVKCLENEVAENSLTHGVLSKDSLGYFLPANIAYLKSLVLPYKVKVFTIEFAALLYNSPQKYTYKYKMENFDDDWNYSGTRNSATYTNLPPGSYVFKVLSANSDGVWSKTCVELSVVIVSPFWKTWWFITFVVLGLFGVVWLYIIIRELNLKRSKQLLEEKVKMRTQLIEEKSEELRLRNIEISKQKEEIAFQAKQLKTELINQNQSSETALLRTQVNPHFLFNTLNNIYSLVYQKSESAPEAIMKLSEIMRYMLYEASSEVVPLEKEINYLKSFIELQTLRMKQKDCVEFSVTGDAQGKNIAPMLFIPFVENAFKHGDKRAQNPCIVIKLALNETHIQFTCENLFQNKNVRSKDQTGGIGLKNVRRRLELLYPGTHSLEIIDNEGKYNVTLELSIYEH